MIYSVRCCDIDLNVSRIFRKELISARFEQTRPRKGASWLMPLKESSPSNQLLLLKNTHTKTRRQKKQDEKEERELI